MRQRHRRRKVIPIVMFCKLSLWNVIISSYVYILVRVAGKSIVSLASGPSVSQIESLRSEDTNGILRNYIVLHFVIRSSITAIVDSPIVGSDLISGDCIAAYSRYGKIFVIDTNSRGGHPGDRVIFNSHGYEILYGNRSS